MGKLSDILKQAGGLDGFHNQWNQTDAASDFEPLPPGEYVAHIVNGELEQSRRRNTPGYKLKFKVIEGEFIGRHFWLDIWLTPAALPMAKRDLGKLGVTDLEQLERPLPRFIRCNVKLALRREDDGSEFNRVRKFDVLGIDEPEKDAFAPDDGTPDEGDSDDSTETKI